VDYLKHKNIQVYFIYDRASFGADDLVNTKKETFN